MKKVIIAIALSVAAMGVQADQDKAAGQCAALLYLKSANDAALQAINSGNNKARSQNYATQFMRTIIANKGNQSVVNSMVWDASSSCRKVGIRASDYIR